MLQRAAIFLCLALLAGCADDNRRYDVISPSMYDSVPIGASYAAVAEAIGREGELDVSKRTAFWVNERFVACDTYVWSNADGSHMNGEFENHRLVSKVWWGRAEK